MTGSQGGDEPAVRAIHVDPLTRPWQTRRDNGTDYNGTFSRPLTDWKGSSWGVRKFWQNGGTSGAMMRLSQAAAYGSPALHVQGLPGGVANTADKIEIRYHKPDLYLKEQIRLIHVILIIYG